jgi:hypothetical protein
MNKWFEVGIRYEKLQENGQKKKVTENYLIDSLSFTEGETTAIKELSGLIDGEFEVKTMKKSNVSEIFQGDAERFYRIKAAFISFDNDGQEKRTAANFIVQADDIEGAIKLFKERMKGTMSDVDVISVSLSPIVDVYVHKEN